MSLMAKRMFVMLTVTLLLVGGLGFVKFKQIQTAIAQGAAFQPPPEAVTTIVAAQEQWPSTINAIGTMAAVRALRKMPVPKEVVFPAVVIDSTNYKTYDIPDAQRSCPKWESIVK